MKRECGALMREKRVSLGISAEALSSRTGISTAFITMIERGGCDDISVGYALKLEQALGLPYGFFGENMPTEKCDIRPAPTECLTEVEKKKLRMPSARVRIMLYDDGTSEVEYYPYGSGITIASVFHRCIAKLTEWRGTQS